MDASTEDYDQRHLCKKNSLTGHPEKFAMIKKNSLRGHPEKFAMIKKTLQSK